VKPNNLIARIQSVLSPNLLHLDWKEMAHPMAGHCYHASEALYHLYGKDHGFTPAHVEVYMGNLWGWVGHWYLYKGRHKSRIILDPTAAQFGKIHIPYDEGRGCGFLTKQPSKRACEVMRRLKAL
jgi:hypothetical protein